MILTPTSSPNDWRTLLADPDKHWRKGHSAMSLAHCWEQADGFPKKVQEALETHQTFKNLELLLAIPEYKVDLPGGRAASQNDLFVLARSLEGLVVIMVEGKVNEPFGPLVSEWFADPSPGKINRLEYLCDVLGLSVAMVQNVRYQLLHRTASAIISAHRFHATSAVMLVHSFSRTKEWFEDFDRFADLYGFGPEGNKLYQTGKPDGVDLFLGWVSDDGEHGEGDAATWIAGSVAAQKCRCCGHHEIGIITAEGTFMALKPGDQVQVDRVNES